MRPFLGLVLAGVAGSACRGGDVRHATSPSQGPPANVASPVATRNASSLDGSTVAPALAPWSGAKAPAVETDWCIDAVETLDEETCFVLPEKPTSSLLVYFHGIVPPTRESHQKANYQTVVANAARRAGVAAIMPRGKQGFAPPGHDGWWGWPTTEPAYRQHAGALVDSVSSKVKKMEALLHVTFTSTYVAGSSSGAYFVAALALHGGIHADGFAAISGGAGRDTPELARLDPKPFYIGYGAHDTVRSSARALGELLRHAGWPVRVAEHPLGHGTHEVYLDEAFRFFSRPGD